MKRFVSIVLALVLVFSACAISASAYDLVPLKFDKNGEFKIMHLCDCQDDFPADTKMIKFIDTVLKEYQPDIVVLGGDNTVGPDNMTEEMKRNAVEELCNVFVANEQYFTLVFGNHDRESNFENDELLPMYQLYGKGYCLAYDEVPSLHGTGTHNLPVMSSDGTKIKFNLWMFDSGSHYIDDEGNDLGFYDCVRKDQIEWYQKESNELATLAGGKVPSLAFQHIVVGEVFDALFHESLVDLGVATPKTNNGKIYSFFPKTENIQDGFLFEFPCPSEKNEGQFEAMVAQKDVLAIFSGHDHINSYTTELDGIKIINTPGATYNSYGNEITRGMRMITVKENDPWNFETEVVTVSQFALDNKDFAEDAEIDTFTAGLMLFLGDVLLALNEATKIFSSVITMIFG
ncbi:MAG: metallophosphoesterase [Clostridia bacterium]|nr:metallophosphoesterase [Clostridia bacterium]MBR3818356.1 metallophosphoesterase [Clostridia bacterium]